MKIWMPCSPQQLATFAQSGQLELPTGFAMTPEWAAVVDDDDEEFLEDAMLDQAGDGVTVVVVAQLEGAVVSAQTGQVSVEEPVTKRNVRAFFAKSDATDEDFSWFGPTETANLLDFLGLSSN